MTGTVSPLFTWRTSITESGLSAVARHVALTLALYMSDKGDSAFPSMETLADDTGLAKSTVVKAIRILEEAGYLIVMRAPGKRGGRTRVNHYRATIPRRTVTETTVPGTDEVVTSDSDQDSVPQVTVSETVTGDPGNGPPEPKERSASRSLPRTATTPSTTPGSRPRDPIWDGFAEWLGTHPATRDERGKWNRAVKQLREIGVDSSTEVVRRGRRYQAKYQGVAPTPLGLVGHWGEFESRPVTPIRSQEEPADLAPLEQDDAPWVREGLTWEQWTRQQAAGDG